MTTAIGTIEDLVRVLDDNPEWLEALRARLLTREMLEMPNALAQFAAETDRRFAGVDQQFVSVNHSLAQFAAETDRRFVGVNHSLAQFAAETNRQFAEVKQQFAEVNRRLDGNDRSIRRLEDNVAILKGAHARNVAQRDYGWMTRSMGLQPMRLLPVDEVDELALKLRETGVSRSDLESFRKADMIIEAADAGGETVYVAVEVSFTVDERDTGRATRNARYLTRVTGKPARAAVIGSTLDDRIRAIIASGEVYWHQFSDKDMQAD